MRVFNLSFFLFNFLINKLFIGVKLQFEFEKLNSMIIKFKLVKRIEKYDGNLIIIFG